MRQIESVLIGGDRGIKELLQRVLRAKLVVIDGEFRLNAEANIFQIGGAGLRGVDVAFTVLRNVPQKSGSQEASKGSE